MYVKHLSFNIEESMILWVLFVLGERERETVSDALLHIIWLSL